ncbi:hypothetical protein IE81DRAFT_350266 [Ceraceosorus guamensis]|uniref:Uncharacterized protein n=1 Tax=Ceraceosorus guamensis TaxID=1522189 RepID=A0A316VT03_9BASI|nr:hypothetical protein IE81DRAFT_350266 [Ceraceosorus guamensis]PWN39341.1 hypothetical protein IE81DRAFT_350266 [Ceraceosorus guamensis]
MIQTRFVQILLLASWAACLTSKALANSVVGPGGRRKASSRLMSELHLRDRPASHSFANESRSGADLSTSACGGGLVPTPKLYARGKADDRVPFKFVTTVSKACNQLAAEKNVPVAAIFGPAEPNDQSIAIRCALQTVEKSWSDVTDNIAASVGLSGTGKPVCDTSYAAVPQILTVQGRTHKQLWQAWSSACLEVVQGKHLDLLQMPAPQLMGRGEWRVLCAGIDKSNQLVDLTLDGGGLFQV